jgi:hypothetical protein
MLRTTILFALFRLLKGVLLRGGARLSLWREMRGDAALGDWTALGKLGSRSFPL